MAGYTQADLTDMLAEVRLAISKTLKAQEENQAVSGMGLRRPLLRDLLEREKWLLNELAKIDGSGSGSGVYAVNRVEFGRPR